MIWKGEGQCRELIFTASIMSSACGGWPKQPAVPGAESPPLGHYGPSAGLRSSPPECSGNRFCGAMPRPGPGAGGLASVPWRAAIGESASAGFAGQNRCVPLHRAVLLLPVFGLGRRARSGFGSNTGIPTLFWPLARGRSGPFLSTPFAQRGGSSCGDAAPLRFCRRLSFRRRTHAPHKAQA